MSASPPFIVITGNIAAGKSTLVERLAMELGVAAHQEIVEDNPFFAPPPRHSLESETWFLADAARTHRAIQRGVRGGVQERSVYEQVAVFARARARLGWLSEDELGLLAMLSDLLCDGLQPPSLLIYVEAGVGEVKERIAARGRPTEQELPAQYLSVLGELYDEFVAGWRLSPVYRLDTSRADIREQRDFQLACDGIREILS